MNNWTTIPTDDVIKKTAEALTTNNFNTIIVENGEEAKQKVLEMIPEGSEVLANTSQTLEKIGIMNIIDNSGKYTSVRKQIFSLDQQKDADKIRQLRSTQEYALGSAHAITQDGRLLIASNSGSQLPSEIFGAKHVILVIGAQKIVPDVATGEKRIYEYILPLESVRARKAYGLPDTWDSFVSKLLINNREPMPGRVDVILVKEALGF